MFQCFGMQNCISCGMSASLLPPFLSPHSFTVSYPMADAFPDEGAVGLLYNETAISYSLVSSFVLFIYDSILTFPTELKFVSTANIIELRLRTGLYIAQRFFPFINLISLLYFDGVISSRSLHQGVCVALYNVSGLAYIIGIGITEILLTLRTRTLWTRNRRLTIGMNVFFLICWIPNFFVFIGTHISTDSSLESPASCPIPNVQPPLILSWFFLVIYQSGILSLTLMPNLFFRSREWSALAASMNQDGRYSTFPSSRWMLRFYAQVFAGTIYHVWVFAISLSNMFIILACAGNSHCQ
ncbi:hypothetical protein GYMLUDRAFT_705371 [Collybiopsis luxurians FD-317 M1]|uniref:DUF6533 domain-containing protein n=1 Tax=Collybiopsis luxurians FD-317 M1 TaxID=944289 RepID=A0A0D0C6E1_9AGAR|nr:hypothetical protein GYMLUDRAFT_705371 [Collybiopsis luxurians FD-317 M1]